MKKIIPQQQERLLINFEKYIESGERDIPFFCKTNETLPRTISNIIISVYGQSLQEFMTEYSNNVCSHPECINFTKYKVTGHKYDTFCSTHCRYKITNSNVPIYLTLDRKGEIVKEMIVMVQGSKKLSNGEKDSFLKSTDIDYDLLKGIYAKLKQTIKKGL
jgi:hypothetical protein